MYILYVGTFLSIIFFDGPMHTYELPAPRIRCECWRPQPQPTGEENNWTQQMFRTCQHEAFWKKLRCGRGSTEIPFRYEVDYLNINLWPDEVWFAHRSARWELKRALQPLLLPRMSHTTNKWGKYMTSYWWRMSQSMTRTYPNSTWTSCVMMVKRGECGEVCVQWWIPGSLASRQLGQGCSTWRSGRTGWSWGPMCA